MKPYYSSVRTFSALILLIMKVVEPFFSLFDCFPYNESVYKTTGSISKILISVSKKNK